MQKTPLLLLFLLLAATAPAQFLEIGPAEQRAPHLVEGPVSLAPAPAFTAAARGQGPAGTVDPLLAALLQHTLDSMQAALNPVGLSAALALPDGNIWEGASGINSEAPGDTLHPGLLLGIGSASKNLTAAGLLRLQEEGLLSLDDSLGRWLPPFPNVDASISLRQLLNHTSGIASYTDNPAFWQQINANLGALLAPEVVVRDYVGPPTFAPGASWGYSNTNYLLAALAMEAAADLPYHEVLREQLFTPQALATPFLLPQETTLLPLGNMWLDINGDGAADDFTGMGLSQIAIFSGAWAAGAYCASAADMAGWIKRLMEGEVLQSATLDAMMETVQLIPSFSYGLGLYRSRIDGRDWWGHDGYIFYQSLVLYQPELGIGMTLMSNDGEFEDMGPVFDALVNAYLRYLDTPSSVSDVEALKVRLFPNPTAAALYLSFDAKGAGPTLLTVLDAMGRELLRQPLPSGPGQHELDVSAWPAGLYTLRLRQGARERVERFVKGMN